MKYIDEETCHKFARRADLNIQREDEIYVVSSNNDRDSEPMFEGTLSMIYCYLMGYSDGKVHGYNMKGNNNG